MAHCNIKDPETGLWNCWSTVSDGYLLEEWLPEDKYKAELVLHEILGILELDDEDYFRGVFPYNLITYIINDDECTLTLKHLHKVRLEESRFYTKKDCDEIKARMEKCDKCNHENCEDCDDADHFVARTPDE